MNRRDAAFLAHLDAIDQRWTGLFATVIAKLDLIQQEVAGLRLELATHRHNDHDN
jgi:hypothetical protein